MEIFAFLFAAVFVERVVEHFVKPFFGSKFTIWVALALALVVSFAYRLDLMAAVAPQLVIANGWQWASFVFTGLVIAGGSNFLHDLIASVRGDNDTTIAKTE